MQIIGSSVFSFICIFQPPTGTGREVSDRKRGKENKNSRPKVIGRQKDMHIRVMQVICTEIHTVLAERGRGSSHTDSWVQRRMLLWGKVALNKCVRLCQHVLCMC